MQIFSLKIKLKYIRRTKKYVLNNFFLRILLVPYKVSVLTPNEAPLNFYIILLFCSFIALSFCSFSRRHRLFQFTTNKTVWNCYNQRKKSYWHISARKQNFKNSFFLIMNILTSFAAESFQCRWLWIGGKILRTNNHWLWWSHKFALISQEQSQNQ